MKTSIINSLGYGSGLDVPKLVADLAAASREPKVARLDRRTATVQASISAVAQAQSDLDGFASSFTRLVAGGTLQSQPTVSDPTVLAAQARPGTRLGDFSATVEVTQLARGQTLASVPYATAATPVGQGTLTITIGGVPHDIAIGAADESLSGIAAAVNAARTGVSATVATDTNGARLVFKGASGTASAFTVSSADPGLASLSYPGGATLIQAARDARFTIDGLDYTRGSNSIEDAIPGVTLTLQKAAPGQGVTLGTARNGDTLKSTLGDFVSVFNQLKGHIAAARTATNSDLALRQLDRQLGQLVAQPVTSGDPASLSAIGIKTQRDGTLLFDEGVFNAVFAASPDAVEAIFSPTRDATHTTISDPGIAGALATLKGAAIASNGALSGLTSRLSKQASALGTERARMETRETAYAKRLEAQFGGLDSRVGALKATKTYLDQQIKLWTASR